MDKVKVKVIGVLRERGGAVNVYHKQQQLQQNHQHQQQQQQQSHQVGVGVSAVIVNGAVAAQDNAINGNGISNANGISDETDGSAGGLLMGVSSLGGGLSALPGVVSGSVGGGGVGTGGGAARTTIIARPQLSKLSALDLAGILNTRRRLEWTKEWLRKNQTEFLSKENILSELQFRNNESYHLNYFLAITESQFRFLVQKLEPEISQYPPQRKKKSFSAEERLAITLKYLATGEVHSCRNYCFRASKPVIFRMIANICLSFYTLLKDQYLQLPKTDEQWQRLTAGMQHKHELTNCIGNLFMREIQFHNASNANANASATNANAANGNAHISGGGNGSALALERKQAPLIFSGIVDSENNFLHVDVEFTPAKTHNDIYEQASVHDILERTLPAITAKIATANNEVVGTNLSNGYSTESHGNANMETDRGAGYYLIGDASLPTKTYLLTAQNASSECSKLLDGFNVHTEQTLRILCNMFPILAQPMRVNVQHTRDMVLGCVALYNFLRQTDDLFHQRTDNIVKQPWEPLAPFVIESAQDADDSDDDCIMLASEEEIRERSEFTPSVGLTTCFQILSAQIGETSDGLARREWLMRQRSGLC